MTPAFQGEVQFAGYTDSSRNGPRVTLRLADRDELQRFVGLEGRRFMVALVEIADDGTPAGGGLAGPETQDAANRRMRAQLDAMPLAEKPKGGPLARLAGQWCGMQMFQGWIERAFPYLFAEALLRVPGHIAPGAAREYIAGEVIRRHCGISSRRELDHDKRAADRFDAEIRRPFMQELQRAKQEQ